MLFDFKDNNVYDLDIDLDYFNLNSPKNKYEKLYNKRDEINLENGFFLGNIFSDSYKPYKNYKPKKINAYSEQQKLLLMLQELDFILNDLNLYLDVHSNDTRVYEIFKNVSMELDKIKKKYYDNYQVLELCHDNKNKYTWTSNPWPWDGGYYV